MERKPRRVYTPAEPPEEIEAPQTAIGNQIKQEEEAARKMKGRRCATCNKLIPLGSIQPYCSDHWPTFEGADGEDQTEVETDQGVPLEAKLIDLGIEPEELKQFCKTASLVPSPLPSDPWESYDTVHGSAQGLVKELKRCGAKTYHIRQALEGAIRTLEGDEDGERRINYERGSEEEAEDQQSTAAGLNDEAQEEDTQREEA